MIPIQASPTLKHRRWNKFRAWWGSYFWLPCARCGQMFGGHEIGGHLTLTRTSTGGTGQCLCKNCPGQYVIDETGRIVPDPEFNAIRNYDWLRN